MSIVYANRGMGLEMLINYANEQYERKGIANIKKVATPWKVIRNGRRIVDAFPEGPSTVDYMGEVNGRSLCFEAKQTKNATSFPLSNFEPHQIEFMQRWKGHKFAIIEFTAHREVYFLPWEHLIMWWDGVEQGGRKSMPYTFFQKCRRVEQDRVVLDYLKHVGGDGS